MVVVFLLLLSCLPLHAAKKKAARKTAVKQEQSAPAPPPGPLTPLTLAEMPAVPPQVSFRENLLTIVAENCTLGDILRAVRTQTGAAIDVPANATERVAIRLGPGPARLVLASLLNGSHFDYVLLGKAGDTDGIARVLLMNKTVISPAESAQANQPVFPTPQMNRPGGNAQASSDDEDADGDSDDDSATDDQPQPAPGAGQAAPQPGVKTPEQLLQELQQQQQMLQQQQQQQPQPPAPQSEQSEPQQ